MGASIAYNLSKRGVEGVTVLERSSSARGAHRPLWVGTDTSSPMRLSIKLSKESLKIIEKFNDLAGYDPLATRDGYIFIASCEESLAQLKRNRELAQKQEVPVRALGPEELQRRFPFYQFDDIIGGTLCMQDGHASTFAVLQGFISKSRELVPSSTRTWR